MHQATISDCQSKIKNNDNDMNVIFNNEQTVK
jgi:hypothetical protein